MAFMEIKGTVLLALVLALLVSIYTKGFSQFSPAQGNLQQTEDKVKNFISQNLVQPGTEFEIKSIEADKGLYKVTVDLQGNEIISYASQDLTTFFPSAMDMDAEVAGVQDTAPEQKEIPKTDEPEVRLFVQSFCPFGNQAEEIIKPVVDLLADEAEVELRYILYENYGGGGKDYCLDEESKYCSMHGISELNQDIRELCVYNNQKDKFWDFVLQVNQDCTSKDVDTCWEEAAQAVGLNTSQVKSCFDQQALAYAEKEKKLTDELEVNASPTLMVNGVVYQGNRTPEAFKQAICSGFNQEPEACQQTLEEGAEAAPEGGCGE